MNKTTDNQPLTAAQLGRKYVQMRQQRDAAVAALRHAAQTLDAIYSGELDRNAINDVVAYELPEIRAAIAAAESEGQ